VEESSSDVHLDATGCLSARSLSGRYGEESDATRIVVKFEDRDTNHSIFITKQDEIVRVVLEAAEDSRNPL